MQKIRKLTKSIKTEGNIRSMRDVSELKSTIESYNLVSGNKFNIEIVDSFATPSALIGYLLKLVQQDAVKLSLGYKHPDSLILPHFIPLKYFPIHNNEHPFIKYRDSP